METVDSQLTSFFVFLLSPAVLFSVQNFNDLFNFFVYSSSKPRTSSVSFIKRLRIKKIEICGQLINKFLCIFFSLAVSHWTQNCNDMFNHYSCLWCAKTYNCSTSSDEARYLLLNTNVWKSNQMGIEIKLHCEKI